MKARIFFLGALAVAMSVTVTGCQDDDDRIYEVCTDGVRLSVPDTTAVGGTYMSLTTPFGTNAQAHWTKVGYCLGLEPDPDMSNIVVEGQTPDGMAFGGVVRDGVITATVTGLKPSTTYHVRAFVSIYKGETVYSEDVTFTTTEGTLEEALAGYKGPEYPDDYTALAAWADRGRWNLGNVHDPAVVRADDGYYYMYQTDASYGNAHEAGGHFHGRRSKDLVNWEYLGGTMKSLPEWVVPKINELRAAQDLEPVNLTEADFGYWAPDVAKVGDTYRMYYSLVPNNTVNGTGTWAERAIIGMMENPDPANNDGWVDKGYVICSSTDKVKNYYGVANNWANALYKFNAIDPSIIVLENGENWLIYGSWHSGIAAVKLDPATGKPAVGELGDPWLDNPNYGTLIATRARGNRWQATEGPEVIYRNGYYYLFLAADALDVPYNTRVVRSQSITGPYEGIDGANVTNGADPYPVVTHPYAFGDDHGWVGISHCTVFDDGQGNWFYASQGRFPANWNGNQYSNAIMLGHVRAIRWTKDGWPLVMPERYGNVPQAPIAEAELTGTWQVINLSYSYGNQKKSVDCTLGEDHTVAGGPWDGKEWTFDADNSVLTVNGVDLYLYRECDWENATRPATIVCAGYAGRATWWAKKL